MQIMKIFLQLPYRSFIHISSSLSLICCLHTYVHIFHMCMNVFMCGCLLSYLLFVVLVVVVLVAVVVIIKHYCTDEY